MLPAGHRIRRIRRADRRSGLAAARPGLAARPRHRDPPATTLSAAAVGRINPPDHTRIRKLLAEPFTPRALRALHPAIRRLAHDHIDRLEDELDRHGQADFATIAHALPVAVMCELFGLPAADQPIIARHHTDAAYIAEPFPSADQATAADAAMTASRTYLLDHMAGTDPDGPGAIPYWLRHPDVTGGTIFRDDLAANITFVGMAGTETSSALATTALLALETHPDQASWLHHHPDAWPGAIEELLRWDPPVHSVSRYTTRDTTLAGIHIPADTLAHLMTAAANRDPRHFTDPDPDRLDLGRRPARNLAFGAGAHYCIGAGLARLTATEFLPELFRRIPTLRTTTPAVHRPGTLLRTLDSLPVTHT